MNYKKNILVMWAIWAIMPATASWAQSYAEVGLVQGAIGGAVTGQVIGRNTQSTLLGSVAGGMLGLMIGSSQDSYQPAAVAYRYADERPRYRPAPVYRDNGGWVQQYYYHPGQRIVVVERPMVVFAGRPPSPGWGRTYPSCNLHTRDTRGQGGRHHRPNSSAGVAWRGYR